MADQLNNEVERAFAELQRGRAAAAEMEKNLAERSTTVTTKRREVSVTVDSRGALTEIRFPTPAFRSMAPVELGKLIVESVGKAREQALSEIMSSFEDAFPGDQPFLDLVTGVAGGRGTFRLDQMVADVMGMSHEEFTRPAGESQ